MKSECSLDGVENDTSCGRRDSRQCGCSRVAQSSVRFAEVPFLELSQIEIVAPTFVAQFEHSTVYDGSFWRFGEKTAMESWAPTAVANRELRSMSRYWFGGIDTHGERFRQEAHARDIRLSGALRSGLETDFRSGDVTGSCAANGRRDFAGYGFATMAREIRRWLRCNGWQPLPVPGSNYGTKLTSPYAASPARRPAYRVATAALLNPHGLRVYEFADPYLAQLASMT